ncbi:NAD(P)-binding protein [Fragilariopsis cylindrus CCMP1102]|uniref:NAD(P)-binding protein n=1 Tax=Fragilariopsis cylindrus CCMP1102 TaxID=635003 RepID=A0A1E7ELQ8_9STRA|nr:NAD(P)-binding protein [Fragilariopsis cylindrus CCMP1102]|eukprot:OEU06848.1 NAD(P)-binding protein [Fragilariopsis cylindrus CCMP1102]
MTSGNKEEKDYDDEAKNKNEQPTCDSGDDVANESTTTAAATATATKSIASNFMRGKIILITGSNRGIGKAFVDTFISYGVSKIYAGVRDIISAKKITFDNKEYNNQDVVVIPIYIDMNDVNSIITASKQIEESGDRLDIVINNAGVLTRTCPLDNDCVKNLQYEMNVNVYGLINLAKYFSPILGRRRVIAAIANSSDSGSENECGGGNGNGNGGIFVQVNSVASLRCVIPEVSTYSASKAAAFSITQSLKKELWSKYGISVMSIHPGPILTDMIKEVSSTRFNNAPPPSIVAESLIDAIITNSGGDDNKQLPFMIYPDIKSKSLGKAYQSFAEIVHEQGNAYAE